MVMTEPVKTPFTLALNACIEVGNPPFLLLENNQ